MNYSFVNHFHCVRGQGTSSIVTNPTLIFTVYLCSNTNSMEILSISNWKNLEKN